MTTTQALSFNPASVRRGNRILLLTAVVLGAVTLLGALLPPSDWQPLVYTCGLTGLVGFGTNWLAIKMLFHPYRPILGIQGVIPRKRQDLARRAAQILEERLISGHHLSQWIQQSGSLDGLGDGIRKQMRAMLETEAIKASASEVTIDAIVQVMPTLIKRLTATVEEKVQESAGPFAGLALSMVSKISGPLSEKLTKRETIASILADAPFDPTATINQLLDRPDVLRALQSGIAQSVEALFTSLKVRDLLEAELNKQSEAELEALINDATADQLVFLQVAGGVLGVFAGVAMVWPPFLIVIAAFAVVVMLVAMQRRQPRAEVRPLA